MRTIVISVLAAAATLGVYRSTMLAAPEQTRYPGEMTQARVWIENRARPDAIAVSLQDVANDAPAVRVRLVNAQNAPALVEPLRMTQEQQSWEYRTLPMPPASDLSTLNTLGLQGWEVAGSLADQGRQILLLKRPRR
jgi:hypothetical protein